MNTRATCGWLFLLTLAACGGAGSVDGGTNSDLAMPDLANPESKFLGTFLYGTGATFMSTCPGQTTTDISAMSFTVTAKSATLITFGSGGGLNCSFDFSIDGDTATLVPNQMCMVTVSGITVPVTGTSGTFTTSDGKTGSLSSGASVDNGLCTTTLAAPSVKAQ